MKNKNKKKYILILVLFIIALVLGIVNFTIKKEELNFFEKFIKDGTSLVSKIITVPVNFIKNEIIKNNEKEDLYDKYKELQKKYNEIELKEAKINELEKENKSLRDLLEIKKNLIDYTYLNATVMNRNVGYWYDTITLDKGEYNGVGNNMAVITSNGLIGKIVKTSSFTSTVKLLASNDLNMKISVKINVGEEYLYGLLTGYDDNKKCYIIEGISNNLEIPLESEVTTTGMSEIFPSGILVGTVKEVGTDNFDLSKIIYVDTKVNYDNLIYVTILKRNYE